MRITKRQLKRIIKEEMKDYDGEMDQQALQQAAAERTGNPRHASPTAQMWAKQSGQDLYVNLTDEQQAALDDLERAVDKCIAAGVTDADMTDTIESRTMS